MHMRVILFICIVGGWHAAPQPSGPEARFIGNMSVALTDAGYTLITDFPYESGYSGYMTYDAAEIRSRTPATLALITHGHRDHWDKELFSKTNWKVAAPTDVTGTVGADRVLPLTPGQPAAFGPFTIEAFTTPHARIGHQSYVVTWRGKRLYFSGDTESPDSLVAAGNVDVAFVSPWLYRAMVSRGRRIEARRVVIYHHQPGERVEACQTNCSVPSQGQVLRIE
jgi:L-ascorbate metabolism protein UlaG (beta-lactamase superfamily)